MDKKVGLAIMRLAPLHKGHCLTINAMIQECETVIIGLGSCNKKPDKHDPFSPEVRMQMIRNVYGDRLKIVPLVDIEASSKADWINYVFDKLKKLGMQEPTDYFTGSVGDSSWYSDHFYNGSLPRDAIDVDRYWHGSNGYRILHIIDRNKNEVPSASELRTFMELRSDMWKQWIPRVNWELVEDNYPEEFKL